MDIIIAIALFSLLILSLFYALERAFESYSKLRYELDKKQEKRYALVMEDLLEKEYQLRGSLKIAVNLFLIVFGVACALIFNDMIVGVAVAVVSVLLVARLIPSLVATLNSAFVLQYFIYLAKGATAFFSPFLGREPERAPRTVEKEENNDVVILQNALNFSEVKVKECMIPRTEICAVPEDSSKNHVLDQFADSKYSRILVYRENIDKITGYVHSKDLFTGDKKLKEIIREIDYVSEETDAQTLLAMLIKNRRSIAVVNDEYGGTAGIVTLEDLIEEIFGEISDELDREELPEKKLSDTEYIFSGRLEIKYLNREYDLDIPESDDYETLGGFITWFNENIPEEGESLKYSNFEFSILKTASNRVESVVLKIEE
jgi:CBS domain containing-hemolysin-like protein